MISKITLTGSNFNLSPSSNVEPDKSKTSAPISERHGNARSKLISNIGTKQNFVFYAIRVPSTDTGKDFQLQTLGSFCINMVVLYIAFQIRKGYQSKYVSK